MSWADRLTGKKNDRERESCRKKSEGKTITNVGSYMVVRRNVIS